MRVLFTLIFLCSLSLAYNQTQTFTTSGSFTVPAGVTSIFVECWGAGGAGGAAVGTTSFRAIGGGGGGGSYVSGTISVMPGDIISYTVAPTTGANTNTAMSLNGGSSTFGSISASGGNGGESVNAASNGGGHIGGSGGVGGIGTFNGGTGGSRTGYDGTNGSPWTGSAGGGGAGDNGSGGDASNVNTNNTGGAGGMNGGGVGATGRTSSGGAGSAGSNVGGGGAGGWATTSTVVRNGGAGARGQIRITYTALPIKIRSFNANKTENSSFLKLVTASETNNDYFTIERSGDGRSFEAIGEIKGAGNSAEEKHYEFTDENPLPGINYYRIKQTDFDGQYSYSEIKSVQHTGHSKIVISPLHTDGRLHIHTDMQGYDVAVFSSAGQEVTRFTELSGYQSVSIESLQSGLYIVKVLDQTFKVFKY